MPSKILALLAFAWLLATGSSFVVAQDVTLDAVTQAWKATQQKVRSGTFRWETRQWLAKGSRTAPLSAVVQPENELTLTYDRTLTFSNGKVRYESEGPHWDPRQKQYVDRCQEYTWDGETAARYTGDADTPDASLYNSNVMLANSELRPIQNAFRMFEPTWFVFDSDKYSIAPSRETVDGLRCWSIETAPKLMREKVSKGRKPLKAVYTVCPERNYTVVRYAAMNEATGIATLELQIEHSFDEPTNVWVPSAWTITHYGKRGPSEIETSTVREYSLNEAVADDQFAADLPGDTLVTDMRTTKDGEAETYILRVDGQKRAITRDELLRGATHHELVATESGMAGLRQSEAGGVFSSPVTFAWLGGILLLVVAAGLVARRQMRA